MSQTRFTKTALAAALVTVGIAFGAHAQTSTTTPAKPAPSATAPATNPPATTSPPSANETKLDHRDRKFLEKAAEGGMAEVEFGKLAQDKGASDQVKQFGKRMVDDHSKANDQLKSLASSKGVNLPAELDHGDKRELDKLSKKSGADFDREYMKRMVKDHKKDVSEFEGESKKAKDADVKNFASSTLPTLQQHLDLAKSTEAAVKNEGKMARSSAGTSASAPNTGTSNTPPTRGTPTTKAPGTSG